VVVQLDERLSLLGVRLAELCAVGNLGELEVQAKASSLCSSPHHTPADDSDSDNSTGSEIQSASEDCEGVLFFLGAEFPFRVSWGWIFGHAQAFGPLCVRVVRPA
jgi:hypothetical protein